MTQHQVDIFGLTETNYNWQHSENYRMQTKRIQQLTKDKKTILTVSDSNIPWRGKWKPGGTCTITSGNITQLIRARYKDEPYGRWSSIVIEKKRKKY